MKKKLIIILLLSLFIRFYGLAQDFLPNYTDYLADNIYLIHPANAGIGDCTKIRLTARKQWLGYKEAPNLQTFSFHTGLGKNNGLGFIVYKDENGYHSQVGGQITYAYHIDLSDFLETHLLSFGLSLTSVSNSVDYTEFITDDPIVFNNMKNKYYYNADVGLAYQYFGFFSYFSLKNIVKTNLIVDNNEDKPYDFMQYLASVGYNIEINYNLKLESSTLIRYKNFTKEKYIDLNLKANYKYEDADFWGGVSYRKAFNVGGFEDADYLLSHIGVNYNNFIFSYAFSFQFNNTLYPKGDYHQLTLGANIFCKD